MNRPSMIGFHRRVVVGAIAILGAAAGDLDAQARGVITGTVVDSVTRVPIVGARVTAVCEGCYGRHASDSAGTFRIAGMPAGNLALEVHCPSRTLLGQELTRREAVVVSGGETRVDISVPPDACTEPPYTERVGTFRGHYTPGFESSQFVPCHDAAAGLADGLLPGKRLFPPSAWTGFTPEAREQRKLEWPADVPRDRWGNPTYFVIWRGTLKGPGSFGHLGVSEFSLLVDSVLTVRRPGANDCE